MGLGIARAGRLEPRPRLAVRDDVLWFVRDRCGPMLRSLHAEGVDEEIVAHALLHPGAESVTFDCSREGSIEVHAKTSTLGPGYHDFVAGLLDDLGRTLAIAWQEGGANGAGDPTSRINSRDRGALEAAMLAWLASLARQVRDDVARGVNGCAVNLPRDHRYQVPAAVLTPLGPRDAAWLEATAQDAKNGIDLFPWWQAGDGFEYRRGRALTLMWSHVRWRPPSAPSETRDLEEVHRLLSEAFALEPDGDLPFDAWREVVDLLDVDDALAARVRERAAAGAQLKIGYRRHPVRVTVGGAWSLVIPGSFAEFWGEDGTWTAYDEGRTVLASTYAIRSVDDPSALLDKWSPSGPHATGHEGKGWRGRAIFAREESDRDVPDQWALRALAVGERGMAALTILLNDAAQKDWAFEIWRSLES